MELLDINLLKQNGDNPRFITEQNLLKLQRSLQENPDMLKIRPIVVNQDNIIIGGNMRYKAAKLNGLQKVWVERVQLSTDKIKEFIIKDNINSGAWEFNKLTELFDPTDLDNWGLHIPEWFNHNDDLQTHDIDEERRHGYGYTTLLLEYPESKYNEVINHLKNNKIKLDLYLKERLL